jgi:hypothetical protein
MYRFVRTRKQRLSRRVRMQQTDRPAKWCSGYARDMRVGDALRAQVREVIGAFAAPDVIHWAPGLPKTRSGKIMRRCARPRVPAARVWCARVRRMRCIACTGWFEGERCPRALAGPLRATRRSALGIARLVYWVR